MRKWFSITSALLLLLAMLIIAGIWQFNRLLNSVHIEQFNYRLQKLNFHEVAFSKFSFIYNTEKTQHAIQLDNVHLHWQWQSWFHPYLTTVNVAQAQLTGLTQTSALPAPTTPKASFVLPKNWSIPASFPAQVHIQRVIVKLPCSAGTCSLAGEIDIRKIKESVAATVLSLNVQISPGQVLDAHHQLHLNATYSAEQNLPKLEAKLSIDHILNVQLTSYLQQAKETQWLGSLKGSSSYPDEWWQARLKEWNIQLIPQKQPATQQTLAATSTTTLTTTLTTTSATTTTNSPSINVQSEWQLALTPLLNLPSTASASEWKKALTGRWQMSAHIPVPLNVLELGEFTGQAAINLATTAGQLNRYELTAEINATHLSLPQNVQALGLNPDALHIQIHSKVDNAANLAALPIAFSGNTEGSLHTNVAGNILVDVFAKKITLEHLALAIKAKQLKLFEGIELNKVNLDMHASGHVDNKGFAFTASAPSKASLDLAAKAFSIQAKSANLSITQLNVIGGIVQGAVDFSTLKISSEAVLKGGKVHHPQFNTNSWDWQGKMHGSLTDFTVIGELGVGAALRLKHQIKRKLSELILEWQVPDIFLLAANPFADTLTAWPPLLSLARGKMNAKGNISFNTEKNSLIQSKTYIDLSELTGIYDTMLFQELSSSIAITTTGSSMQVATDEIKISQIDKGFVIGPLSAAGKYSALLQKPAQGKLSLKYFTSTAMDGSISTAAQEFDFSRDTQHFMVELKNINLASLLKQHSTSELSGSGKLSGNVPVEITPKGIRINQGNVSAAAPGGQLKYQSPRADALAKTQPSMKLITEALNDFHYSVLTSHVNYNEKGKLLLSVRLEGKNPALEKGRPIHFKVNLEEDIPAMLASIQLSSKVTDVVKKRVQEYLQKKPNSSSSPE